METSIEKLVAICFLVIGLSHILQPRAWVKFFIMFREKGEVGSILNGLLHFPPGRSHCLVSQCMAWHSAGCDRHGMGSRDKESNLFNVSKTRDESIVAGNIGKVPGVCCGWSSGGWA